MKKGNETESQRKAKQSHKEVLYSKARVLSERERGKVFHSGGLSSLVAHFFHLTLNRHSRHCAAKEYSIPPFSTESFGTIDGTIRVRTIAHLNSALYNIHRSTGKCCEHSGCNARPEDTRSKVQWINKCILVGAFEIVNSMVFLIEKIFCSP